MLRTAYSENTVYLTLLLLLLLISGVSAEIITVRASGSALTKALARSKQGDTLELEAGTYRGKFFIPPRVSVVSKELHKAVINGSGYSRAIIMLNGSTIHGISVTNSKVGVYSEGIENSIIGCRIYNNRHSGIVAVASFPRIEHNIIFRNTGSGITLWDVSTGTTGVTHNTIVFNGNHGISVGGESDVLIQNNIIAYNHKLKIKTSATSTITQMYNNYYMNVEINELLPEDNYSFDPKFTDVNTNNFTLSETSRCINSGADGSDIGTEIFANFNN